MTVNLRAIQHVQALAKLASFSRAADELGISQPTLSRSIQGLEVSLGLRLFDRGTRGVEPTAAGQIFLSGADRVLHELTKLEREIQNLRDVEDGTLDLGAGLFASAMLLGPSIARLVSRHPRLRIVVHPRPWHENVEHLRSGEFEILLGEPASLALDSELEVEVIAREPGVVFCRPGHPLLSEGVPDFGALLRHPIAAPVLPENVLSWLRTGAGLDGEDALQRLGIPAIHCEHPIAVNQIVMGSDAIGFSTASLIRSEHAAGLLEIVPLPETPPTKEYALIRVARREASPAAASFAACVRAVVTELMGGSPAMNTTDELRERSGASRSRA